VTDQHTPTCHVVTHVHWDREWYRPFEGYRSRLLELVERVCNDLDVGTLAAFHLDGQTITLDDVAAIRPDLAERAAAHARSGRLTIGPWHVLADNQLVSGENLIRNLLIGRARGRAIGAPASIGYSPDAFGHPADLPRVLNQFGIDTALVWRGAPPEHPRFRWRAPDGSEVFAVNQAYHQAEVLWDAQGAESALGAFVEREQHRVPAGPWLLLNGGDHLAPASPRARAEDIGRVEIAARVTISESTLDAFFAEAVATAEEPLPTVTGELRALGDWLTFLLPGTLSARRHVKALNDRAEVTLERFAEPALASALLRGEGMSDEPLLRHAWELLVQNAPHDSICGCSLDEVHRETTVRAERVIATGEQLVARSLQRQGLDTRGRGPGQQEHLAVVVQSPHGTTISGPVELEITTAADRYVIDLLDPDGHSIQVEAEDLGDGAWFDADLDILPDTHRGTRHRIAFIATDTPAFGWAVYTVVLGAAPHRAARSRPVTAGSTGAITAANGYSLTIGTDATIDATTPDGITYSGMGRLVDGGDRGDTYNYDPPLRDELVTPRVLSATVHKSTVRTRLEINATLDLPSRIAEDRDGRSPERVDVPVTIDVTAWAGQPEITWTVRFDNTACDHRLRWHVPIPAGSAGPLERGPIDSWAADTHWSVQQRPMTPALGALPTSPGLEAACGTSPAHTYALAGAGDRQVAVLLDALPEVQGLANGSHRELAVTVLRSIGWLSRFDLRTRTAGAGPAYEVPEAQSKGHHLARLAVLLGEDVRDDLVLAQRAALHHVPLRAHQLTDTPPTRRSAATASPTVIGALVTAWKPGDAGTSAVLRVANPTSHTVTATIDLPAGVGQVRETRFDETSTAEYCPQPSPMAVDLKPFAVRTFELQPYG